MRYFTPPLSGGIARFPVWEVIIHVFAIIGGFVGLYTPDSPIRVELLGDWSLLWSIAFILAAIISLIGLVFPAPDGLLITLLGGVILMTCTSGLLVGYIFVLDKWYFSGATTLYIFTLGAAFRNAQILWQLALIREKVREH